MDEIARSASQPVGACCICCLNASVSLSVRVSTKVDLRQSPTSPREKAQWVVWRDKPPTTGSANQYLRTPRKTVLKRQSAKLRMLNHIDRKSVV